MPGLPTQETTRTAPHVLVDARFAMRQHGGDRCRYELATNLIRQAEARYTFLTYAHAETLLSQSDPSPSIVVAPYTPNQHPQADWYEHIQLPRLARRLRTDIYHGTFNVLPLRTPARITILTVHDMAVFAFPQAYGKRFVPFMQRLLRAGIRRATRIISVSEATKREIVRYYPEAEPKIVSILNGVGKEFLEAATLPPQCVQEMCYRLRIPRPYVLFVGNLEPKKNLARLVEAFQRLRASTALPHTLVIVGKPLASGPSSGLASEDSAESSGIHFTGYVEDADLPLLYRGADLVAYPSLYEGFGMPVLEGMAAGVPVLTSSVSSLPEVAGGAALLVDPVDIEAIATGLHRALTDVAWREKAVRAGRARAEMLSWESNARQSSALYHQLWDQARHASSKAARD